MEEQLLEELDRKLKALDELISKNQEKIMVLRRQDKSMTQRSQDLWSRFMKAPVTSFEDTLSACSDEKERFEKLTRVVNLYERTLQEMVKCHREKSVRVKGQLDLEIQLAKNKYERQKNLNNHLRRENALIYRKLSFVLKNYEEIITKSDEERAEQEKVKVAHEERLKELQKVVKTMWEDNETDLVPEVEKKPELPKVNYFPVRFPPQKKFGEE